MTDDSKLDCAVGYGRPPIAHRFKPGQSGNPKGRPKRVPLDATAVLDELVNVTVGGKKHRKSAFEVTVRRLIKKAIDEKDLGACQRLLQLMKKYGLRAPASPSASHGGVITIPINSRQDYEAWDGCASLTASDRARLRDEHGHVDDDGEA